MLAALSNRDQLDGPIDASFWADLDDVIVSVHSQTFGALTTV